MFLIESSGVQLLRKRFKNDLSPNIKLNACPFSLGQKKHPMGHFRLPVRMHWQYACFELKAYFSIKNVKDDVFTQFCWGVQIRAGGQNPLGHRDDISSHLKYYHLSSEILDYKLILFRSGHFDHDIMEKKITVIGMF